MGLGEIALLRLPAAVCLRAWRKLAYVLNDLFLQRINDHRFSSFEACLAEDGRPRFYVIVMPDTLHFLLPCLALLQRPAQVVLLCNGAHRWEKRLLAERLSEIPVFSLWTLPMSSVAHGQVINLLLRNSRPNFGLVDHDCYILDDALFRELAPMDDECLIGLFGDQCAEAGLTYPHTYFVYFNSRALREVMRRNGVDGRLYRKIPSQVASKVQRFGLGPGRFWKSYHNFYDTLHVLLATALAEGYRFRFLSSEADPPAVHIGGTSIGSHHTKDIFNIYDNLAFLELLDDPLLSKRYGFLTAPIRSMAEVLRLYDAADPRWQRRQALDGLMARLRDRLGAD